MELVIKMQTDYYPTDDDICRLLKYIAAEGSNSGKEKLLLCKGKGVSDDPVKAALQMIKIQKYYKKDKRRRMYHLIISFPPYMRSEYTIKHQAELVSDMLFERYQVFYAVHKSTGKWHIHFAFNAVSYVDGKKWHQNMAEMRRMKEWIYEIYNSRFL